MAGRPSISFSRIADDECDVPAKAYTPVTRTCSRRSTYLHGAALSVKVIILSLSFVILLFLVVSVIHDMKFSLASQVIIATLVACLGLCMHCCTIIPGVTWPAGSKHRATITIIMLMMFVSFHRDFWHPETKHNVGIYIVDNPNASLLPRNLMGFVKALTLIGFGSITARLFPVCEAVQDNNLVIASASVFLMVYVLITQMGLVNVVIMPSESVSVLVGSSTLFFMLREYVNQKVTSDTVNSVFPAVKALAEVVADTLPVVEETRRLSILNEQRYKHRTSALGNVPVYPNVSSDETSRRLSHAEVVIRRASKALEHLPRRGVDVSVVNSGMDGGDAN